MKRNNPKTQKPFEKGYLDVANNLVFFRYRNVKKKDGFFSEEWVSPEAWEKKYKPGRKEALTRNNPATGKPFKRGDTDDQGRIFRHYDFTRVNDDGYYIESWSSSSKKFAKIIESQRQSQQRRNDKLKNTGRLTLKRRLNLTTGKHFTRGDTENDKFFIKYELRQESLQHSGNFAEIWADQEGWDRYRKNERTPERLATVLCNHAKARAKKHGGIFSLDKTDIAKRIEAGFCEVTNLPFVLEIPKSNAPQPFSPSLDRIDNNNRDYSPVNVRVVISAFNNMRGSLDETTLKAVIEAYLKNN